MAKDYNTPSLAMAELKHSRCFCQSQDLTSGGSIDNFTNNLNGELEWEEVK